MRFLLTGDAIGHLREISEEKAAGLDRPVIEKSVGARSTPPEGDVAVTHNGLKISRPFPLSGDPLVPDTRVRLSADAYRKEVRNVEEGVRMQPGC
jgi:hypothetical protein